MSQRLCWQLLTFHIICALFLHHMTAGKGKMGAKQDAKATSKPQKQLVGTPIVVLGHGTREFTHIASYLLWHPQR